jgi:hypothetical protein
MPPIPICTIRSQLSVLIQPKYDDGVPIVSQGTGQNTRFLNIVNESNIQSIDTSISQFKNLIDSKIGYLANTYQYAETAPALKSNLATTFPQGFVLMSTDTSTGSYISYRLTNSLTYAYNLNTNILFLINQTISQLPFTLSCDVYTSSGVKTSVFTPVTSMPQATPQSLYRNINASIPQNGGYIEIRIDNRTGSALPASLSNYLFISNTGTKVPAPVMTYASSVPISSTYMNMDTTSITLNLKPSLASDSLNGHTVQFTATKSGTNTAILLGSPIAISNGNSVTLQLTKGQLTVGVYAIKVVFNRPGGYITNYLNDSTVTTNQLSYTVTPQKIVLTTLLQTSTLSYLRSLIATSTTDYDAVGKVSLKIVDADANISYEQDSITYSSTNKQYSFSKNVSGNDSLSLMLGNTYRIITKFTPNDTVNYLASDDVSLNATVDPYRMALAVNGNLSTIKYRDSITFTSDTVTGNVHVDVVGTQSISIYKSNGELIETKPSPYTLSPYMVSNYLVGDYKAKAVFEDSLAVRDSSYYPFSITAQDTVLTVKDPISRVESDGRLTTVGVFEYSYNAPFTVSGTLKTGTVSQANASELTSITNFVLIRTSNPNSPISSPISNVILEDDVDAGVVKYSFTVSSPEDIGVGLTELDAVDFNVAWQPSGEKYLESRSPIKVKALKDFVTLTTVTNITGEQIMQFEDTLILTCTVANEQPSNSPSLNGSYTLKHKMKGQNAYDDVETKLVTDNSNTVSFNYNTLVIGDHMFCVDYNVDTPLSNNFYDEIRTPSEITVKVTKVDTNFNVQLKDVEGNVITTTTASDVYKKLKYHVTNCLSQFGAGHAVAGKLSMSVGGLPDLDFNGTATEGYFVTHTLMQYLINVNTTSFTFTFTPTDLDHYNVSIKTLSVLFKNPGPLVFGQASFVNATPSYLEKVVVNLQYTLIKNGADQDIPLVGTLELLDNDNTVFSKQNVIVNTNDVFPVDTEKNPYEFGYNSGASKTLTVKFTPTSNSYIYYTSYSKNLILTPVKQTLQVVNIITTNTTYTHGLQLGLKVNTNDTYQFSGTIVYNIKKVGSILDPIEVGRVTIANNYESTQNFYRTPDTLTAGDDTNDSTLYQISCDFISSDSNFNNGITSVVTKTITYEKSTLEMKDLEFSYIDGYSLLPVTTDKNKVTDVYNDGINIVNKSSVTISGKLYNTNDTQPSTNVVSDGTVYIVTRYFDDERKIQEIEHAYGNVSNNSFTITHIFEKSIEIFLKYKSNVNFKNQDLDVKVEGANYFETFYISLINTPYDITMSLNKESAESDYHDGFLRVEVHMNFIRSTASTTYSDNADKILLSICSEDETEVLYSTKLDLKLLANPNGTTTYSDFLFNPRKLSSTMATKTIPQPATTALTNGLEAGNYVMKAMYEGIAGFYDPEQAVNVINTTQKYIKFTVEKTVPGINSYLTHLYRVGDEMKDVEMIRTSSGDTNMTLAGSAFSVTDNTASFFYRELPIMAIRIQSCQKSHNTTYDADNDLLGTTVVEFLNVSALPNSSYIIDDTSLTLGAESVNDNIITNITGGVNGFKTVTLPKINAGSVHYIALRFTPTDTRNYTIKNVALRTEVKKYTPVLLNAPNTNDYTIKVVPDKDGSRSSNVLEPLSYETNGVINYDENFEVHNKLQRKDPLTDIPYDMIDGELLFRYYSTAEYAKTSIDDTIPVVIDNNKLDYKTTFNPMIVLAERINIGISQTMIVSFKPADLVNYNESEPISRNFSIYVANSVGIVEIRDPVPDVVVFNKQPTLTLTSTVTFGPDVEPKTGKLSFYWGNETDLSPVFTEERLLSISKNDTSTGALEVGGLSADYSLAINTADNNNVMLTPRYHPYVILAKLTPTSNNYPVIIHQVTKTVQINPSLVITISSTKGKTSVSGPNTLSYIEVGDADDDIILKATLVHHNEAYSGGVANFIITKNDNGNISTYVAGVPFTNNVAEFRTKTVDYAQNIKQNGAPVSQFTMGFGEYVVQCQATFGDSNPMYKPISQDYLNGYLIRKRTSTYSLSIDKTNIVYGNIRPKVTTKFDQDFVYGGYFTYTIIYTSVNGVTTIEQVQNLTNDADKFGSNPPSQTYTLELSSLVDSSSNIIDLTVGSYSIESTYSSPPNFSGSSSNTVYFVVNKKDVVINPLNNYYVSSNTSQFTLSATLANPDITDSSVKFVNTTTNQVYSATYSDAGTLILDNGDFNESGIYFVSVDGTDLLAGTYEIMAYFSGNFNYNKSNNVFSNVIIQRKQQAITLSVSSTVNASNEYTLDVNTDTGDTVHVYSTHKKEAIAVLSHTDDHLYKIADTLLNVGLNRVFVTVVHPNYSGNSNIVEITRPKMPLTVSSFASSASTVPYKGTVTLTATVDVTGRGYTVTEGETMDFYVNDSHVGTVDVANDIATLPNVCLREMGANVIVAKFVNSKSYVCENTHSSITVTVTKANMAVTLYDETSSDMNKLNNKTVSLYLGTLTPTNKTNTTDDVVEFSRINSGTATFYNNNDIIYDDVPVINGVASISLSMDLSSYSIKARFNGNVNYNSSDFSSILTFTTTQKAISDYYASVTLAEGSKNDGKTCYIVANVALKSGVASMPASSLLLNTGVVTFTFAHLVDDVQTHVTKIVNLVDGVATANFKSSSKNTLPTVVYSNTAYSGTLSPSSNAWPVDPFTVEYNEFSTEWIAPGNEYLTGYFYNPFVSNQSTHYTFNSSKLLFIKTGVAISIKFSNNINAKIVDNIQSPGSNNPTPYVSGTVINVPGNKTIMIQITSNKQYISFQIIRNYVYEIDGSISVTNEGKFNSPTGYYRPNNPSFVDPARAIYFDNNTNHNSFGFDILANI